MIVHIKSLIDAQRSGLCAWFNSPGVRHHQEAYNLRSGFHRLESSQTRDQTDGQYVVIRAGRYCRPVSQSRCSLTKVSHGLP